MNQHDLKNVLFLLSSNEAALRDWYDNSTHDDHEYACEIMKAYQEELFVKLELLKINEFKIQDAQVANNVLERYRL